MSSQICSIFCHTPSFPLPLPRALYIASLLSFTDSHDIAMNTSDIDEAILLDEINREKAIEYIPISIYIAVLFFVGIIGNGFVIAFYSDKSRLTPTTRLIFMVGVIDEMICILMPETFAELAIPYKFTSTIFCKIYYFINYILCLWESYVLLSIGVFRYRKICVQHKKQFTVKHANYATVMGFCMAILITFPVSIFFHSIPVQVNVRENVTITGHECNTAVDYLRTFQLIHNIIILTNLTSIAIALLTLYGLTVGKLRRHNETISLLESKASDISLSSQLEENCKNGTLSQTDHDGHERGTSKREEMKSTDTLDNNALNVPQNHSLQKIPVGMTTMLFIITVIFILSYLPYVAMTIASTITRQLYRSRSNWLQFVSQSYRLNSVLNPFVYGYYNTEFRGYVSSMLYKFTNFIFRRR